MQNTTEKSSRSAEGLYKFFIYFVLILLAVTIIVPVAWVFMASIKQNAEFYGNPWALPAGFYWQNFVNAWNGEMCIRDRRSTHSSVQSLDFEDCRLNEIELSLIHI